MSFHHYRTQGFVIKKSDRREADQILAVYTKDFGKLEILAKGIRKIKSKLRSGADLFYFSEIEFIQGKNCKTLIDARAIKKFGNIKSNLETLVSALRITEALDSLVQREEKDKEIWKLFSQVLEDLDRSPVQNIYCSLAYYYFLWNLLSILGYKADLYNCVICQNKLTPSKLFFNPDFGGIICDKCSLTEKESPEISPDIVKILRIFQKNDWQTLSRLRLDDSYKKSLKLISDDYFNYHKLEGGKI